MHFLTVEGRREGGVEEEEGVRTFYCRKTGRVVASCPVLNKADVKQVALVNTFEEKVCVPVRHDQNSSQEERVVV